jgi:hypothetical protein
MNYEMGSGDGESPYLTVPKSKMHRYQNGGEVRALSRTTPRIFPEVPMPMHQLPAKRLPIPPVLPFSASPRDIHS